jgi:uncharacterized protein (DUF1015 family)
MVAWAAMPLVKPLRALRYDAAKAGPLDDLVAPPHDVITPERKARLLAASPYNAVRLVRPDETDEAAGMLADWRETGILVRDEEPAVWALEEEFVGPDGLTRMRRGLAARVRLEPYESGRILPHERTFEKAKDTRLSLLRATRTKLSPVLLLHEGGGPERLPRAPDLEAELDGARSRLWRLGEPTAIEQALDRIQGRLIIADGHHRYETALRFHQEEGTEETGYVLAVLVSRDDPGLTIFPTHRLVASAPPELDGHFRLQPLEGGAVAAVEALDRLPRDRAAFVMLRPEGAVLALADQPGLDTVVVDRLALEGVSFTPSAAEAEAAVMSGRARAAFLVRPPELADVEAMALSGERMPEKSTYFFPKLTSGLLFSPFDE